MVALAIGIIRLRWRSELGGPFGIVSIPAVALLPLSLANKPQIVSLPPISKASILE
jgi:hypothetical protein